MYSQRALQAAAILEHAGLIGVSRQIFEKREQFLEWLSDSQTSATLKRLGPQAQGHSTSPIIFSQERYIGGCDAFEAMAAGLLGVNDELSEAASRKAPPVDQDASLDRFKVSYPRRPFKL
jgi:glutaredoxin